ncbi:MAG: 30S ribosomal protein S6 [Acidimicrobiia bacterium]|nr:30S ribosomal protein S6 [Acidimicrobiia bacterium]
MRTYELMTIHRPDLAETEVHTLVSAVEEFLGGRGATVSSTDLWGKRRFAYEIDHLTEGYYSVINFSSEAELIADLDRMLSLADEVVRHKVFRPGA